jgi:hypothetical protein
MVSSCGPPFPKFISASAPNDGSIIDVLGEGKLLPPATYMSFCRPWGGHTSLKSLASRAEYLSLREQFRLATVAETTLPGPH